MRASDLTGTWYNELMSEMIIDSIDGKHFRGRYKSKVGDASGYYELTGQIDTDDDSSRAIGWNIVWNNGGRSSDSVTAWSGQAQTINGADMIVTTWLLTGETTNQSNWLSTRIGKDIFTRTLPSEDSVLENKKKGISNSFPVGIQ